MNLYALPFFVIGGYLIGSLLFARVVARFHGVNLEKVGSGNPGSTNVVRTIGKGAGILAFLGDFFKAFIPVMLVLKLQPVKGASPTDLAIGTLLGVILGHNFPLYFKFRGGKGVSVAMGGISALMPGTAIVGMILWCVIFHATGFVSAASLFFALSLPITSFAFGYGMHSVVLAIFVAVIIFWCHRGNIKRLWNGSEYRFDRK